MGENSGDRYDSVPFRGRPVVWASPSAMGLTAAAHGGPLLALDGPLRVLELGCGDGAHLVPLAFFRPELTAVGVDTSAGAIGRARALAEELDLGRARFEERDLTRFEADGPFDLVVAHGVYSWIDADARAALRRVAADSLRDGGLAFVSFNAQPAWSLRGRVRDLLMRDPVGTVAEARARLSALRAQLPVDPPDAWSLMLATELDRAMAGDDGYIAHEYLSPHNAVFWLGDVARGFADAGLSYCGDALFDRAEGFVPPDLRAAAAGLGLDATATEEWLDVRTYRQLRAAVFVKGEVGPPPPRDALVERAWIAGAVRRRNDPFDLREGMEEIFDGPRGVELRVKNATLKVALLLLADQWPRGWRLEELHAECARRLEPFEVSADPPSALAERLAHLHTEMQIELRLEDARVRTAASERPRASALSRQEAAHRVVLTTPLHSMLPLEPIDRAVIGRLDGSRTPAEVSDELAEAIASGDLELGGAPAGLARIRPLVEQRVRGTITTLEWWGLVE